MFLRLRHSLGWGTTSGMGMHVPSGQSRLDFQVHAPLGHGESLYVVGDAPGLGNALATNVDLSSIQAPLPLQGTSVPPSPQNPTQFIHFNEAHYTYARASNADANALVTNGVFTGSCRLVTTPDVYPLWYNAEPVVISSNTVLNYRYAVCCGGKFVRYENIERSATLTGDSVQIQDVLDQSREELYAKGQMQQFEKELSHTVVPRLSSGQAFVERRATAAITEDVSRRGVKRASGRLLKESFSIPEGEEKDTDEEMSENAESPAIKPIEAPASPLPWHDVESSNLGGVGLGTRRRSGNYGSAPSPRSKNKDDIANGLHSPQNLTIESTDGVIIVVHRLPVLVTKREDGEYDIDWEDDNLLCPSGLIKENKSNGLLYRDGTSSGMRLQWVGLVHCKDPIPKSDEEKLARQLQAFHCVPVFPSPAMHQTFHAFCYGTLWPVFHNIVDVYGKLPTRWWNPSQQKNAWSSYMHVNRMFVNKVIEIYNEGDLVWVHGLHLLVAPSFLARRLPYVNVGLFLHTPFPSSEIFRSLSVRADLLRGMLSADHIGFHLFEHARHFLTSCRRILGLKYTPQAGGYVGVEYNGRMVAVTISHIGIEPPFLERLATKEQVIQDTIRLKELYRAGEKTIVVGIDQVERLKGINLKFLAIEQFLKTYPEYSNKIQVIQIGIVDGSDTSEAKLRLRQELNTTVQRINNAFPQEHGSVIAYSELNNTDLSMRLPLWNAADIMLLTTVRDAVSLYPFEFVYAHKLTNNPGVVVVSEFSGSSRVLTGSLGVNPWKRNEIVAALHSALTMSPTEKAARHEHDLEYISLNTRTKWAERILVDLKRTSKASSTVGMQYMGYGLGLGYRMLEFNAGFKLLETDTVVRAYRHSFRRVLLFDYGNTLQQEATPAHDFSKYLREDKEGFTSELRHDPLPPSHELVVALNKLCADPRNIVFVLSGRERGDLEKTLGGIRGLGLAAEHGYLYRWGDSGKEDEAWLCTKENFDDSWKDITHSVMDIYTQRTHGTYIELKGSALLWQFRDADPEFGQLQAKELHDQLTQVLESYQVEVLPGTDYLEVRPEGVDKGVMVDRILSTLESQQGSPVDFVLCIGDDRSDEFMFSYLEERNMQKTFTVTVGKKPSAAKQFLNDVDEVMELLHALTKVSTTSNRNLSMNDLRLMEQRPIARVEFPPKPAIQAQASQPSTLKSSKYSMSMSALSSAATNADPPSHGLRRVASTSATSYEQYCINFDEEEEDDGGIFF